MSDIVTKHKLKLNKRRLEKFKQNKPKTETKVNLENDTYTVFDTIVTLQTIQEISDFIPKFNGELQNIPEQEASKFKTVIEARTPEIFFYEFGNLTPVEQAKFMNIVNKLDAMETVEVANNRLAQYIQRDIENGDAVSASIKVKNKDKIINDTLNKALNTTLGAKQLNEITQGMPEDFDEHTNSLTTTIANQFNKIKDKLQLWYKRKFPLLSAVTKAEKEMSGLQTLVMPKMEEAKGEVDKLKDRKAFGEAYVTQIVQQQLQDFLEQNKDFLADLPEYERTKIINKEIKRLQEIHKDAQGLESPDLDPILDTAIVFGGASAIAKSFTGATRAAATTGLALKEIPSTMASVAVMNDEDMNFLTKAGLVVGIIAASGITDAKVLSAISKSEIKNILLKADNPIDAVASYLVKKGYDDKEFRRGVAAFVNSVVTDESLSLKQKTKVLSLLDITEAGKILPYIANEPMYKATKVDVPKSASVADKALQTISDREGNPVGWMHLFEKGDVIKGAIRGSFKEDVRFINSAINFKLYEDALNSARTATEAVNVISEFFDNAGAFIKNVTDTVSVEDIKKVITKDSFRVSILDGITNSLKNQNARNVLQEFPSFLDDISKGIHKITTTAYKKAISNLSKKEVEAFIELMERGDELRKVFPYKQIAKEFGEKVADAYVIARHTFDQAYEYSNNLYVNMFRNNGYKQTIKGDIVKILGKASKDSDIIRVRSVKNGAQYTVKPNELTEVTKAFDKLEGYVPWRYTARYYIYQLDHSTGTYKVVAKADTSKDSIRILRDLELANDKRNISYVRTKAGVTPTVRKEVRKSTFEDVMYRIAEYTDEEIALQQMGLSAEQIASIQRQPLAKIRGAKKKNAELKSLFERLDIYSRELSRVLKDDYISALKDAFVKEYGKYLENPRVWYSPINEELIGAIPITTKRNIKYLQSQLRLLLNMPTPALEKFQRKFDNFVVGRALDAASGIPKNAVLKGIDKIVDNTLMSLPTAKDMIAGLRSLSFMSKLGFSAVHFILQPMHMFQVMFADPDSLPRAFSDITNITGYRISKTFKLPYPKKLAQAAESFLDDYYKSGMPMTTLTTDAPIVGASKKIQFIQKLAALPVTKGEEFNKLLAASMGRRLADKLNLKGVTRAQFIRQYGNRYALDLSAPYTPALSKGVPSVTVGQFSRYFIQQFDLMFRRLNNRERYYVAKAMLHLGGVEGLPVISDVAMALEHEKRDIAEIYYKYGTAYLAPLMLLYYDKIKYADEYDIEKLKELGATKQDLELLNRAKTNEEFYKTYEELKDKLVTDIFKRGAQSIIEHLHGISSLGGIVPDGLTNRLFWSGFIYDRLYGTYGWVSNFGAIVSSLARGNTLDLMHHLTAGLFFDAPKDPKGWASQMTEKTAKAYDEIFSSTSNVIEGIYNFARLVGVQDWTLEDITNFRLLSDFVTSTGAELELDERFNTVPFKTLGQGDVSLKFGVRDALLSIANISSEDRVLYYERRRAWNTLMKKYKDTIDKMSDDIAYFVKKGDTERVNTKFSEYAGLLDALFGDSILGFVAARDLQTEVWKKAMNRNEIEVREIEEQIKFRKEGQFGFK